MAYKLPTEYTIDANSGVNPFLFAIRDGIPMFWEGLLGVMFLLILTAGFYAGKAESGRSKIIKSFATAAFVTAIFSVFFAMMDVIGAGVLIFNATMAIVGFILLSFYRE